MTRNIKFALPALLACIGLSSLLRSQTGLAQNIHVKSDLSNAIQHIGTIVFASGGIYHPSTAERAVRLTVQDGILTIQGPVLIGTTGTLDVASNAFSPLIGGRENILSQSLRSTLIGGFQNKIEHADDSIILGASYSKIKPNSSNSSIAGGRENILQGTNSSIIGGQENQLTGTNSSIIGGNLITLAGSNSLAAGYRITATASNSFIRADGLDRLGMDPLRYFSPESNTFAVRAANGIGINTADPQVSGMDVNGLVRLGYNEDVCSIESLGSIMYLKNETDPDKGGCFCECRRVYQNHLRRESLGRKDNCRTPCAKAWTINPGTGLPPDTGLPEENLEPFFDIPD